MPIACKPSPHPRATSERNEHPICPATLQRANAESNSELSQWIMAVAWAIEHATITCITRQTHHHISVH
eukprot:2418343-Pyramimonas_sp.AAC.1